MTRAARIKPFPASTVRRIDGTVYGSVLASLGFERRCREIPSALGISGVVIPFGDRHDLDYDVNRKFFNEAGWEISEIEEDEYFYRVSRWLSEAIAAGKPTRIAADVSSMSRRRIADVVEAVFNLPEDAHLDIDFLYTPARFEPPDVSLEPPVFSVGPVSESFAGWWSALEKPLHAVVGLGYELERAASALDVLEPESTQIYVPVGNDPKYLEAVRKSNTGLFEFRGVDPNEVQYPVSDPFSCFAQLEASIGRKAETHRISLIPLGPKIFALLATVASALHPTVSQVIRVTAGHREVPMPRRSNGIICGLTVALRPPPFSPDSDEID
jgi:hypothetical protein